MLTTPLRIPRTALLLIDVQNDFCPGGALAVPQGDEVIGPLNVLARRFAEAGGVVVATQDWHPAGHCSFGAPWPVHCVQGSWGAAFHEALDLNPVRLILRKGFRQQMDSYSAFYENDKRTLTGLDGYLRQFNVDAVVLGGLAADYCVLHSALDAADLGFRTLVLEDAVRAVDIPEGSGERAFAAMQAVGISIVQTGELEWTS